MKLLDFVLEWQNPYLVTVNVVVPMHNVTYSRIWLLIKGWMCVCSWLENSERVYHWYRQERLVEKATKISMTISKRMLPGFTDQPQKTPATILKRIMTFHLRTWERHSRSWILSGLWISSRYLLTYPLFNGDHPASVTSQYLLDRLSQNCTSPNGIRSLILPLMLCWTSCLRLG